VPDGSPPRLGCADARAIVQDVHARFAATTEGPKPELFAELLVGWLDPHGLWSAAPDAPARAVLRESASALLTEIHEGPGAPCSTALHAGVQLRRWVDELAKIYDRGTRASPAGTRARAHAQAIEPIFEDDPVTMPARVLSRSLGERLARFARAYPGLSRDFLSGARARYFPALDEESWSEVVLSAAIRAYVAALDPHGAWTPLDEEWSLYADEPGLGTDSRLWGRVTRNAAGVRVVDDPVPPLAIGDLVLSIDGVQTAGMPLEQVEQLSRVDPPSGSTRRVLVVRSGEPAPHELSVPVAASVDPSEEGAELESERVRYGDGHALVVKLPNVADGVEEAFAHLLEELEGEKLAGLLIDLRGNGGGSTDAALGVIGLFLPGAPVFPLASRGQVVEVMRANVPASGRAFRGAAATLVDGRTASAAEMIAGALGAYGRGPTVGARTFGKGCIQEYTEDPTGHGVLRLTSLLFALPNGAPLQGVGITPDLLLALPKISEREAGVPGALPSYSGPDVRARGVQGAPPWPRHHQRLGPCKDPVPCAALARLGDEERKGPSRIRRARRK
jgi:carboxyl-terminal processing protease